MFKCFLKESGGHRWQRIPPTESKGRVHTSTVTVAVLPIIEEGQWTIPDRDIKIETARSSGKGGQHQNKTESAVTMRHLPTGITAYSGEKSQHHNRKMARSVLETRVKEHFASMSRSKLEQDRKEQIGSGMRGDKIRTYRSQDKIVTDHRSGQKCSLQDIMAGKLEKIWR
jgi:peptide chain release factor 1